MRHSEIAIRLPEAMQSERKVGLALLRCEGEGMGACAYDVHRYTPRKGGGYSRGAMARQGKGVKICGRRLYNAPYSDACVSRSTQSSGKDK